MNNLLRTNACALNVGFCKACTYQKEEYLKTSADVYNFGNRRASEKRRNKRNE